jgi:hypothetical protein
MELNARNYFLNARTPWWRVGSLLEIDPKRGFGASAVSGTIFDEYMLLFARLARQIVPW